MRKIKRNNTVNKFLTISFSTFLMFSNLTELQAYEPIDQSFCPYGYHPEGPSFAYDCVSNSTGEIQRSESNRQEHEANRSVWEERWGAIARGKAGGWGAVVDMFSENSAKQASLKQCEATATIKPANCKVSLTYYNQCVAYAWGKKGGVSSSAVDMSTAKKQAMVECGKSSDDCEILYSDCSLPLRIK